LRYYFAVMDTETHPLPVHKIRIKKLKSLLAILENAVKGDNYIFRNLFADEDGKEIDILQDGSNSCAVFVSWVLLTLELINKPHATVYATEKDLIASGWRPIEKIKPGAVVIWERREGGMFNGEQVPLEHIGFCISETEAISNSSKGTGFPSKHHITYGENPEGTPIRKIDKILWHPDLDQG